jgi:hypothetical protein
LSTVAVAHQRNGERDAGLKILAPCDFLTRVLLGGVKARR